MDNNLEKVERPDMTPPELKKAPVPELWARAMETPDELEKESLGEVRDVESGEIERVGQFEKEQTRNQGIGKERAYGLEREQAAMMGEALLGAASDQESAAMDQKQGADQNADSNVASVVKDEMPKSSRDSDKLDKTWFEAVDKVVKKYEDDPYELVGQLQDSQKKFLLQRYGRRLGKQDVTSNLQRYKA